MAAEEMGDPYAAVHDVPYVAVQDVPYAICFTDPASLGDVIGPDGRPCFTSTGDVDDIPSIILLAQTYRDKITFYICDDTDGKRYLCLDSIFKAAAAKNIDMIKIGRHRCVHRYRATAHNQGAWFGALRTRLPSR
jgi:hypothetical protein